jgi:glycerophosphoryl diester phosphodiesterase
MGARWCSTTIRSTADTATGPVAQRSARELSDLLLKGSDERIPTLADVLGDVAGKVPLLIEIKDQSGAIGEGDGCAGTCRGR